jgi:hypothetical protein
MGGAHSIEIPGGGTEGYHVLRVSRSEIFVLVMRLKYSLIFTKDFLCRFKMDHRVKKLVLRLFLILLLQLETHGW